MFCGIPFTGRWAGNLLGLVKTVWWSFVFLLNRVIRFFFLYLKRYKILLAIETEFEGFIALNFPCWIFRRFAFGPSSFTFRFFEQISTNFSIEGSVLPALRLSRFLALSLSASRCSVVIACRCFLLRIRSFSRRVATMVLWAFSANRVLVTSGSSIGFFEGLGAHFSCMLVLCLYLATLTRSSLRWCAIFMFTLSIVSSFLAISDIFLRFELFRIRCFRRYSSYFSGFSTFIRCLERAVLEEP